MILFILQMQMINSNLAFRKIKLL